MLPDKMPNRYIVGLRVANSQDEIFSLALYRRYLMGLIGKARS